MCQPAYARESATSYLSIDLGQGLQRARGRQQCGRPGGAGAAEEGGDSHRDDTYGQFGTNLGFVPDN